MDYDNFDDIGFSNNIEQNDLDQLVQKQKTIHFLKIIFIYIIKIRKKN